MQIKDLSTKTGVSIRTIRYYTQLGLLPEVEKKGNYKDYPENMIALIKKIKKLQEDYIPLSKIKEMLENEEIGIEETNNINIKQTEIETIKISSAMIYKLSNDVTITVTNGKRISQEKLNKIKEII